MSYRCSVAIVNVLGPRRLSIDKTSEQDDSDTDALTMSIKQWRNMCRVGLYDLPVHFTTYLKLDIHAQLYTKQRELKQTFLKSKYLICKSYEHVLKLFQC